MAFTKNFRATERFNLRLRMEAYNVLNHTNFVAPNADITSAAFGTIRATYIPRQIQFALKLMF